MHLSGHEFFDKEGEITTITKICLNMDTFLKIGILKNGKDVYISSKGEFVKEEYNKYLIDITEEEIENIIFDQIYDSLYFECLNALKSIMAKLETLLKIVKGG